MRQIGLLLITLLITVSMEAQNAVIKLVAPDKSGGIPTMKAFAERRSQGEFDSRALSPKDLSTLLWAANGVNRPANNMRTAPSAINAQDVDVYVIMPEGAYLYDAKAHALNLVSKGDYRAAVAGQQAAFKAAPVILVLVSDLAKFGERSGSDQMRLMAAMDVGIVSQNINIACASLGLATRPRASMDQATLKTALKLTDKQMLGLNNPVGYPKK
jgi:SagB-type dehydrogenase family enzyme